MLGAARKLAQVGVLGINDRNIGYIARYNKRRFYPLVDDKLMTKQLAQKAGVAVPELYGVIHIQHQIRDMAELVQGKSGFAIKPASGAGGEGVLLVSGVTKGGYRLTNGILMPQDDMSYHISRIISGIFSLGGHPDKALIEYLVRFHPVFDEVTYLGVPDVRIIVFFGVPVMAMVRLPTRMSDGKANLHKGAIGVGVDMASGVTLSAVWHNDVVHEHPDTGAPVVGLQIPDWSKLLHLAASTYELTGLGYQGVDIVLDRALGPLLLELNARPGLNVQIANRAGLLPRLRRIEEQKESLRSVTERVAFAREHFGAGKGGR